MSNQAIFFPVIALALWTQAVLGLIPFHRVRATRDGSLTPDDFKLGESARVPAAVSIPNRNYMNLLELPLLFYVTTTLDGFVIACAWVYVVFRILHSLVHLSYNKVLHRVALFAISNLTLLVMWLTLLSRLTRA